MSATRQPHRAVRARHCRLYPLVELGDHRAHSRPHPDQACEAHLRALGPHLRVETHWCSASPLPGSDAAAPCGRDVCKSPRLQGRGECRRADDEAPAPRPLRVPAGRNTSCQIHWGIACGRGRHWWTRHGASAIVGRQLRYCRLGELPIAVSTESRAALLLLGDHLPQGRAQPLRHVVYTLLVYRRAIVKFQVTQLLVSAGVAVGEHRGVAEAVHILRPPPHHLGGRLLHRPRRAGVVAAAGGVLFSPSVELVVVVPVVSSGDGTALAVEGHDVVVDDEACHHLHGSTTNPTPYRDL